MIPRTANFILYPFPSIDVYFTFFNGKTKEQIFTYEHKNPGNTATRFNYNKRVHLNLHLFLLLSSTIVLGVNFLFWCLESIGLLMNTMSKNFQRKILAKHRFPHIVVVWYRYFQIRFSFENRWICYNFSLKKLYIIFKFITNFWFDIS